MCLNSAAAWRNTTPTSIAAPADAPPTNTKSCTLLNPATCTHSYYEVALKHLVLMQRRPELTQLALQEAQGVPGLRDEYAADAWSEQVVELAATLLAREKYSYVVSRWGGLWSAAGACRVQVAAHTQPRVSPCLTRCLLRATTTASATPLPCCRFNTPQPSPGGDAAVGCCGQPLALTLGAHAAGQPLPVAACRVHRH